MTRSGKNREGAALLVVLMIIMVGTASAVFSATSVSHEVRGSGFARQQLQTRYTARAGLVGALEWFDIFGPETVRNIMVTRTTTDVRLTNLRYVEPYKRWGRVHVLAFVERRPAARAELAERDRALRELRVEFGFKTFLVHPSVPPAYGGTAPEDELGMGIHGGLNETSVFMHLRPDQVDLSAVERKVPEGLAEHDYVKFGGPVMFGWLSNDFDPDGYIGDPTGANAELGKELFDANVSHLAAQMAEIKTFDFGR